MTDTQTALEVSISRSDTVQAMRSLKEAFSTRNDPQTRVYIEVFERLSSALQSRTEQEPVAWQWYSDGARTSYLLVGGYPFRRIDDWGAGDIQEFRLTHSGEWKYHANHLDIAEAKIALERSVGRWASEISRRPPPDQPSTEQEPVGWQWRSRVKGGVWDAWERGKYGTEIPPFMEVEERPVYTSPPDQSARIAELEAEIASLKHPLRHADESDWDYLIATLNKCKRHAEDAQTSFWVIAMKALRAALAGNQS